MAGIEIAAEVFKMLDAEVEIDLKAMDGQDISRGQELAILTGPIRCLLSGERTALNFLGRLSGIASFTASIVSSLSGTKTRLACTRKTTPGLRALEKYAVRMGGAVNHRFGLYDAVLVKDNHLVAAGNLADAVKRLRERVGHLVKIEVEVDSLDQLDEALACQIDAILLDNMEESVIRKAVSKVAGRALIEVSGDVTRENVARLAQLGVDLISMGRLTHSAPALDVSMELTRIYRI